MPVARFDLLRIRYLFCKLVWIAITCVHLHPYSYASLVLLKL